MYRTNFFDNKIRVAVWIAITLFFALIVSSLVLPLSKKASSPSNYSREVTLSNTSNVPSITESSANLVDEENAKTFDDFFDKKNVLEPLDFSADERTDWNPSVGIDKSALPDKSVRPLDSKNSSESESITSVGSDINRELDEQKIKTLIEKWRLAWQDNNVDEYLNFYSDTFKPEGELTYSQWLEKRMRLVGKQQIRAIEISQIRSIFNDDHSAAGVEFRQKYSSSTLSDRVLKRLYVKKIRGQWKIARELAFTLED